MCTKTRTSSICAAEQLISTLTAEQYLKSGRMKAIGISGKTRSKLLPEVETMVEAGYPNVAFGYYLAGLVRKLQLVQAASTLMARRDVHGASVVGQLTRLGAALAPVAVVGMLRQRRQSEGSHDWLGTDVLRVASSQGLSLIHI